MTALTLVPVTPAHAAVAAAVHGEAFAGHAWDEAAFARLLDLPTTRGALALGKGGEPVGVVLLQVVADEAEVLTIGVCPAARRTGVARALLAWAAAELAAAGVGRLFLEVAAPNAPARALYAAEGFGEIAVRRRYYADGADAHMLVRVLLTP